MISYIFTRAKVYIIIIMGQARDCGAPEQTHPPVALPAPLPRPAPRRMIPPHGTPLRHIFPVHLSGLPVRFTCLAASTVRCRVPPGPFCPFCLSWCLSSKPTACPFVRFSCIGRVKGYVSAALQQATCDPSYCRVVPPHSPLPIATVAPSLYIPHTIYSFSMK